MPESHATTQTTVERMLGEWRRGMLAFWVLGLLIQRPMYGLEIKQEIEGSTNAALQVRPSTIYQLLARLERQGLLESWRERTSQGPPRAYYRITEAGQQVVQRYVEEVLAPSSPISAALSQLTSAIFQQLHDMEASA